MKIKWRRRNNSRSGYLLLEVNLVLVLMAVLGLSFYNHFDHVFKTCSNLQADIRLYQANRYTQAFLASELSYHSVEAKIGKDTGGRWQLTSQNALGSVQMRFYRANGLLYREKRTGNTSGVNPLSRVEVQVQDMQLQKLAEDTLLVTLTLKDTESGKTKSFMRRHRLCNGKVVEC